MVPALILQDGLQDHLDDEDANGWLEKVQGLTEEAIREATGPANELIANDGACKERQQCITPIDPRKKK